MGPIAPGQYSLRESIILITGGVSFSHVINFFIFLCVHSAGLDDAQSDVDDIPIPHGVLRCARVGCANEEARHKGLKVFGGMPLGGHSLPIHFAIFGRGLPVLVDEPIEHVEEHHV